MYVRPAYGVLSTMFAPRVSARLHLNTVLSEAAILMSHMRWGASFDLSWNFPRMAAPPHLQRFLTESAALAITVTLAPTYAWDPLHHDMFWFDDLKFASPRLAGYVPAGPRPDILFDTPAGLRAFESRGRSTEAPVTLPAGDQRKRLRQLNAWAQNVSSGGLPLPAWSMVWASITERSSTVDFFDPGEPIAVTSQERQVLDALSRDRHNNLYEAIRDHPDAAPVRVGRDEGFAVLTATPSIVADDQAIQWIGLAALPGDVHNRRLQESGNAAPATSDLIDTVQYGSLLAFAGRGPGKGDTSSLSLLRALLERS